MAHGSRTAYDAHPTSWADHVQSGLFPNDHDRVHARRRERFQNCIRKVIMANRMALCFSSSRSGKNVGPTMLQQELSKITSWDNFRVCTVAQLTQRRPLEFVALSCFEHFNLIRKLGIDPTVMSCFLSEVEKHYLCALTSLAARRASQLAGTR